jgi:hypothetical protein
MNWKKIQQAWEVGDKQIAVRLLESMIYEMRLRQRSLLDFQGETILKEEEVKKCQSGVCLAEKQSCQR